MATDGGDTDGGSTDGVNGWQEAVDTDADGIPNSLDPDDDNDGISDTDELADGTDPLNPFSCSSGCLSFDIDRNGSADMLTDGLLFLRYTMGFRGEALIRQCGCCKCQLHHHRTDWSNLWRRWCSLLVISTAMVLSMA